MAKVDQIKETLNTLRMYITIFSIIFVTLGAGLIGMYKTNEIDNLFWIGILSEFIIFIVILMIGLNISTQINKIGDN